MTEAGLELAAQIRAHFQSLEDFKLKYLQQAPDYRLAAGNSVLEWFFNSHPRPLQKVVPGIVLHLFDFQTKETVQALVDHKIDFGIIRESAVVKPLAYSKHREIGYALFYPSIWGSYTWNTF